MRVLLVTPLYSQHYDAGHLWLKAFNDLGHLCEVWDYRLQPGRYKIPTEYAPGWQPNLVMVLKGESVDPTTLPHPRFCYWPDALERTPGIEQVLQQYDRVYTPVRPTPPRMVWLPTGWDPDIHRYTGASKDIDSLYIGTNNSDRKRHYLAAIKPQVVAGNGWGNIREPSITFLPPHYLHDFVSLTSRAKVAINIHQGPVGLNRKLFECCACAFTITDRVPGVEEVLGDITEAVSFTTPEEGKTLLEKWGKDDRGREEMWQKERERIAPYTYLNAVLKSLEL